MKKRDIVSIVEIALKKIIFIKKVIEEGCNSSFCLTEL